MNIELAREEMLCLMRQLEPEPRHTLHVAKLSLQLFESLPLLHQLGEQERLLLEGAAYLHDIGWQAKPSGQGHHKESARLIREHSWNGLNAEEVDLMAQVARYHRKRPPDLGHADFARASPETRVKIQKLAALLRLADGLDRRHEQCVSQVRAEVFPENLVLHLTCSTLANEEIRAARKKCDLARTVFKREIIFQTGKHIAE